MFLDAMLICDGMNRDKCVNCEEVGDGKNNPFVEKVGYPERGGEEVKDMWGATLTQVPHWRN